MLDAVTTLRSAGCVFAEEEARLLMAAAQSEAHLASMLEERTSGVPLEHILGWAEFSGVRMAVESGVFVPRRRTEFLVQQAATTIAAQPHRCVVVDLCCGSGAVGAALGTTFGDIELHAVDIDPAAVRCARRNIVHGFIYEGNLYEPLPVSLQGRIDVLVANAPYVPTDAIAMMPREARIYEPPTALDGGYDGLEVVRKIAAHAAAWLKLGGKLFIETGKEQALQTVALFEQNGLDPTIAFCDELDATVVIGLNRATGSAPSTN